MQYDGGILLHERPQPHPSCRPSSTPGDRRGGTPRRDSRKKAGAPTAVRRSRAGQRGRRQGRLTNELRASPLAGASALQARRGQRRTRSLHATRYPRSRERAEKFVKKFGRTREITQYEDVRSKSTSNSEEQERRAKIGADTKFGQKGLNLAKTHR